MMKRNMLPRFRLKFCCLAVGLLPGSALLIGATPHAVASEFELTLASGSVLRADIDAMSIAWTEVLANGDLRSETIRLKDVQQLLLSRTPASQKVADVRKLLMRLGSDDYWERESAQQLLSERDTGAPFRQLIESFAKSPSAEVRYRVEQILSKLGDYTQSGPTEFDVVTLKSGKTLKGDAGQFEWPFQADGQVGQVSRDQLRMLRTHDNIPATDNHKVENVRVEIIRSLEQNLFLPGQTVVDFETDTLGNPLIRKTEVTDTYTAKGIRFLTPDDGHIAISGYGFKFPDNPTGKNSACVFVFNKAKQTHDRFRGTILFEFCVPNQPGVPAGVTEFGVYVARVNHERDFVLEAYNSAGQIVSTVEAATRDCPLLALRSNEPIAQIRIRSNQYLSKLVSRKIDEDFAIDSVCFSTPQALPVAPLEADPGSPQMVQLTSGSRWASDAVGLTNLQEFSVRSIDQARSFSFPTSDIHSVSFAPAKIRSKKNTSAEPTEAKHWLVQLTDHSVLKVSIGTTFVSMLQPEIELEPKDCAAIWRADYPLRLPAPQDFENGKAVIVFPTYRVTTDDVRFSASRIVWKTQQKWMQPIAEDASKEARNEDTTHDIQSIQHLAGKGNPSEAASIWLQQPTTLSSDSGLIQTIDGQRYAFGENALFELTEVSDRGLQLAFKATGHTIELERNNLRSIRFPRAR